jgi:uncharacterized protein (DUF1800 family)
MLDETESQEHLPDDEVTNSKMLGAMAATTTAALLSACGGSEEDASTSDAAGGRAGAMAYSPAIAPSTDFDVWRFLCQATMGLDASPESMIEAAKNAADAAAYPGAAQMGADALFIRKNGYMAWLNEQMGQAYVVAATGLLAFETLPSTSAVPNGTPPRRVPASGTMARYHDNARTGDKGTIENRALPDKTIENINAADNWPRWMNAQMWQWHVDDQRPRKKHQLRMRVAHALMQFLVVSLRDNTLNQTQFMVAGYFDMLMQNAFGNFRDIIRGVIRSPAMGYYLSHLGNLPPEFDANGAIKRIPDQNFARELLQLFTIGLVKLNMDGTVIKDASGNPIPTTDKNDVIVLSNVFTGWSFDRSDDIKRQVSAFEFRSNKATTDKDTWWYHRVVDECYDMAPDFWDMRLRYFASAPRVARSLRFLAPMQPYTKFRQEKVFLAKPDVTKADDVVSISTIDELTTHSSQDLLIKQLGNDPGRATLFGTPFKLGPDPMSSMERALDRIFAHPNLAPFIAKQMIQHLVTSNPSPAYVRNVATAFKNSNWSMTTLIKSILLDTEARTTSAAAASTFGRLKDPYMRVMQLYRAFGSNALYPSETYSVSLDSRAHNLNQSPLWAPSVFNDYSPFYKNEGGRMAAKGLVSPQMQLATESAVVAYVNAVYAILNTGLIEEETYRSNKAVGIDMTDTTGSGKGTLRLSGWLAEPNLTPAKILDRINYRLFGGNMSAELKSMVLNAAKGDGQPATLLKRIKAAIFLSAVSTEFLVQR